MMACTRQRCMCVEVQNFGYVEADSRLKIKADWLRDHISKLRHQKYGHNPAVSCHCELRLIMHMKTIMLPGETPPLVT